MDLKQDIVEHLDKIKSHGYSRKDLVQLWGRADRYIDIELAKGGTETLLNRLKVFLSDLQSKQIGNNNTFINRNIENVKSILAENQAVYNTGQMEFIELSGGKFIMNTPLVKAKAQLGYLTGWGDSEYLSEMPVHPVLVDKIHRGVYRSFETEGDSMDDGTSKAIQDGDILTGRRIERSHWRNKLHLTKFREYVIVTIKKGITAKNIIKHDTEKHSITCHSYNSDRKAYPDFEVSLNEVMEIYNIVQITKKR